MRQRMARIRALAASGALWGTLAGSSLLGCARSLPRDLTVAQQRAAIGCLEAQGFRNPWVYAPACRDAVWAVLAEAEANADCTEDADCFINVLRCSPGASSVLRRGCRDWPLMGAPKSVRHAAACSVWQFLGHSSAGATLAAGAAQGARAWTSKLRTGPGADGATGPGVAEAGDRRGLVGEAAVLLRTRGLAGEAIHRLTRGEAATGAELGDGPVLLARLLGRCATTAQQGKPDDGCHHHEGALHEVPPGWRGETRGNLAGFSRRVERA